MRVGRVRRSGDAIVTRGGQPLFMGQQVLGTDTVLRDLPFWYPIVPTIMKGEHATTGMRYYGFFDIDMCLDDVESGREPLFSGIEPKTCERRSLIKDELRQRLQNALGTTFPQFCQTCPPLERVRVITEQLAANKRYRSIRTDIVRLGQAYNAVDFFQGDSSQTGNTVGIRLSAPVKNHKVAHVFEQL